MLPTLFSFSLSLSRARSLSFFLSLSLVSYFGEVRKKGDGCKRPNAVSANHWSRAAFPVARVDALLRRPSVGHAPAIPVCHSTLAGVACRAVNALRCAVAVHSSRGSSSAVFAIPGGHQQRTSLSDQGNHSPYILDGVYYLKDRESRSAGLAVRAVPFCVQQRRIFYNY